MTTGVGSAGWLNLQKTIQVRTAHKHFVCAHTPKHTHTHTQRGLRFLEGSFQCGWRTADVAKYPTDGERWREKMRRRKRGERKKERGGGGGGGVI